MTNSLVLLLLFWLPNAETNITSYNIYHGTNSPGQYQSVISTGNVTNFLLYAPRGITNYFRLSAVDNRRIESDRTDEISYYVPRHRLRIHVLRSKDLVSWQDSIMVYELDFSEEAQFFKSAVEILP